jgi:hypothetical protein
MTDEIALFLSAELVFLLTRASDLIVLAKNNAQRTPAEKEKMRRGLPRSIVLEAFVFVPASAGLILLLAPFAPPARLPDEAVVPTNSAHQIRTAYHALLGVASYGFPFATIRKLVSRMAANAIREFASIASLEQLAEVRSETTSTEKEE